MILSGFLLLFAKPIFVYALSNDDKNRDDTITLPQFEKWEAAIHLLGYSKLTQLGIKDDIAWGKKHDRHYPFPSVTALGNPLYALVLMVNLLFIK